MNYLKKSENRSSPGKLSQFHVHEGRLYVLLGGVVDYCSGNSSSIRSFLSSRGAIAHIARWEKSNNNDFLSDKFDEIVASLKENKNKKLSPSKIATASKTKSIISKRGKNGGTYAESRLALKFANWINPDFGYDFEEEIERLKSIAAEKKRFSEQREPSKQENRILMGTVKEREGELLAEYNKNPYPEESNLINRVMGVAKREDIVDLIECKILRHILSVSDLLLKQNMPIRDREAILHREYYERKMSLLAMERKKLV